MRKTKIICTLGPAADTPEMLRKLIENGMDAARFNLSHGTHEGHLETLKRLREASAALNAPIATILDTKGPEIRIGTFKCGTVNLKAGSSFVLTSRITDGDSSCVSVTFADLPGELHEGCRILLDDGLLELSVDYIAGPDIHTTVLTGGPLSGNKSINIPGVCINLPSITENDRSDLRFAAENDFDYIAASFVRRASDIEAIRSELIKYGGNDIPIIAKIENREGVENMDAIIEAADGLMVARGDLGVEMPAWDVPPIQKKMIAKCAASGKPVIIATQMLDSMIRNPRPTRAEVSDVANAVYDGASCVMLSGETASGLYPLESLKTMVDTITAAENSIHYWKRFTNSGIRPDGTISGAIGHSCCLTAMDLDAKAILAATTSGYTARVISRFRPSCPIIAFTQTERNRRRLALYWGVLPCLLSQTGSTDEIFESCVSLAKEQGFVSPGDTVVLTAGVPVGISGTTNLIKAQKVV
ncbi:MAG: pyruvate kinase [Oscillospiraceae bacterium]|jgi:pyruvate kinase